MKFWNLHIKIIVGLLIFLLIPLIYYLFTFDSISNLKEFVLLTLFTFVALFVLASVYVYFLIKNFVITPINFVKHSVQNTKEGNLNNEILERNDEMGEFANFINDVIVKLEKCEVDYKESEERYNLLSSLTLEGIIIHNNEIIIDSNKTILTMLGYTKKQLVGEKILKFISDDTKEIVFNKMNDDSTNIYEAKAIKYNGDILPIEIISQSINYRGQSVKMFSIRDITYRKEKEIIRSSVEQIVKHDLKNPINGILGFSHLLLKDNSLDSKHRKYISAIQSNGYLMLNMIDHSMELFQMAIGKYKLKPAHLDLISLFRKFHEEFLLFEKNRNINFIYFLNKIKLESFNKPYLILGEELHLKNLFSNILLNAYEISPNEKDINVLIEGCEDQHKVDIQFEGKIAINGNSFYHFLEYIKNNNKPGTNSNINPYSSLLIALTHKGNIEFIQEEQDDNHIIVTLPKKYE